MLPAASTDDAPQGPTNVRVLSQKIRSLEESVDALNCAHTSWVSKAELGDEALSQHPYSHQWLEGLWLEVDRLIDQANEVIHVVEESSRTPVPADQKELILTQQMKTLRLSITNKITIIEEKIAARTVPPASYTTYKGMVTDISEQLRVPYRELSQNIMNCSGLTLQQTLEEHETFYQTQEKRLLGVEVNLAEFAPVPVITPPVPSVISTDNRPRQNVKMEDCKAPVFNG